MALKMARISPMGVTADYWRVYEFTYRAPGVLADTIASNRLDPSLPSIIGKMGLYLSRSHSMVKPLDTIPFAFTVSNRTGNLLEQVYAHVKTMSSFESAVDVLE